MNDEGLGVYTLAQLAEILEGECRGHPDMPMTGVASLLTATSTEVAYYDNPVFHSVLQSTRAGAVLLTVHQLEECPVNAIVVSDPLLAMAKVAELLTAPSQLLTGIHPEASVHQSVTIGEAISIGAHATIEPGVILGDQVCIAANVVIGRDVVIGKGSQIGAQVYVHAGSRIGDNVIIDAGTVIGASPFNTIKHQGRWNAGPAVGGVMISNSVRIGANTVIDRGALGDTYVAEGVCIDNLVQIAHDVVIGPNTAIAGCAAIGASAQIGADCVLGGASCIAPSIKLVDNVVITGMSTVSKTLNKPGVYSSGILVSEHKRWRRNAARFRRLDDDVSRLNLLVKEKLL